VAQLNCLICFEGRKVNVSAGFAAAVVAIVYALRIASCLPPQAAPVISPRTIRSPCPPNNRPYRARCARSSRRALCA